MNIEDPKNLQDAISRLTIIQANGILKFLESSHVEELDQRMIDKIYKCTAISFMDNGRKKQYFGPGLWGKVVAYVLKEFMEHPREVTNALVNKGPSRQVKKDL